LIVNFFIIGINITQWQLLLDLNPEALEGLSPSTIKCLNKEQIKVNINVIIIKP
jgi:hypothetical protein